MPNSATDIPAAFVEARRAARPLSSYPGEVPNDFSTAYAHQEAAIGLWPDEIAGWKVALVRPDLRERYRAERLAGPVFGQAVYQAAGGGPVEAPVVAGGFAAVEAEFIFRLKEDLSPRDGPFERAGIRAETADFHVGMEIAGSPLASLNDLGPAAVISDFGNNAGIVVGPAIPGWFERPPEELTARMLVDGAVVGEGSAASVPGGPVTALVFLVNHLAERGRTLKRGDWVSSGATTGIHQIAPGSIARAEFGAFGAPEVRITVAAAA